MSEKHPKKCWAITPEKMDNCLDGRKNIVQLAKDPPPCIKNLMVRSF